jgi:hypothetical protein
MFFIVSFVILISSRGYTSSNKPHKRGMKEMCFYLRKNQTSQNWIRLYVFNQSRSSDWNMTSGIDIF